MDFPLNTLLDENKCYVWLLDYLHGGQLQSPHIVGEPYIINDSRRAPVILYKGKQSGKTFNIYTGTVFAKTHFKCSEVVLLIRGFLRGESTAQLARELDTTYDNLLYLQHRFMERAASNLCDQPLPDAVTETDELFQNAGEKGQKHSDPTDPPRKRANKKKDTAPMKTTDRQS
jgi:hypothetical protein